MWLVYIHVLCVCVCMLSHVQFFATLWTVAHQTPLSMEFSRQEIFPGKSGWSFATPGGLYSYMT